MRVRLRAVIEYLHFDSRLSKQTIGLVGTWASLTLFHVGRREQGLRWLAQLHRSAFSPWSSRRVNTFVRKAVTDLRGRETNSLAGVLADHVDQVGPRPETARYFADPHRLLDGSCIVLKSPAKNERGVLLLYYSYTYPLFWKFFEMPAIAQKYSLAIEPSWSGFCDPDVLLFTQLTERVIVGATEPRDRDFIQGLQSNLVTAPFSSNTWTDHRVFRPLADVPKDLDIVMVAGWGGYKRHWAFFQALGRLRKLGHVLKVALVGYPIDTSPADVLAEADLHGVRDQLEIHEKLEPTAVNVLYNRAKVNVLWSRREGVNRAIVEGMFAGVPCVMRDGFNYGYEYPLINDRTGTFATEDGLPDVLLRMVAQHGRYSPREWAMKHMSCLETTRRVNGVLKDAALAAGEQWTTDIVTKINTLDRVVYWNDDDQVRFHADVDYIRACAKPGVKV